MLPSTDYELPEKMVPSLTCSSESGGKSIVVVANISLINKIIEYIKYIM
jgi:hypothetical protein